MRTLVMAPPCGPVDCADLNRCWGLHTPSPLNLRCDLKSEGGGWTILQQRRSSYLAFYRKWAVYKHSFSYRDTFWLGRVDLRAGPHDLLGRVRRRDVRQRGRFLRAQLLRLQQAQSAGRRPTPPYRPVLLLGLSGGRYVAHESDVQTHGLVVHQKQEVPLRSELGAEWPR